MMDECIEEYTADATRFALADAGDGLEDANFDRSVANQAVSYLFVEEEWIKLMLNDTESRNDRSASFSFIEKAFNNEIDFLIAETKKDFSAMNYREGLHHGWYDMIINRDIYRDWAQKCGKSMHPDLVSRFAKSLSLMMQPICPHWSEVIYELLPSTNASICTELWPEFVPYNPNLRKEFLFFKSFLKTIRNAALKQKSKFVFIFTASTYEQKKIEVLEFMQRSFSNGTFAPTFLKDLKGFIEGNEALKKDTKNLMQFGSFMKSEAEERGLEALMVSLSFDQVSILEVSLMVFSCFLVLSFTFLTFRKIKSTCRRY